MGPEVAQNVQKIDVFLPLVICLLGLSPTVWFLTSGLPAISEYLARRNLQK